MTLRVTLEIIPFGREEDAYTIEQINISNVTFSEGALGGAHRYVIEHNAYKEYDESNLRISHKREDGAMLLASKALKELHDRIVARKKAVLDG